jgi:transposase-like protein
MQETIQASFNDSDSAVPVGIPTPSDAHDTHVDGSPTDTNVLRGDITGKGGRRRLSEEQQRDIAQAYAEAGASVADIRQRFAVSEPSVYRVLEKQGVTLRGRTAASIRPAAAGSSAAVVHPVNRRVGGRSGSVSSKRPMPERARMLASNGTMRFRIDFRVERVVNAVDIRDALRQAEALGAVEVVEIIRAV